MVRRITLIETKLANFSPGNARNGRDANFMAHINIIMPF